MEKVIAVTVIHRTIKAGVRGDKDKGIKPIKPEVQVIKPGTIFLVDAKEYAELAATGAIRRPQKDEKVLVGIDELQAEADEVPVEKPAAKAAARKPAAKPVAKKEEGSDESLV